MEVRGNPGNGGSDDRLIQRHKEQPEEVRGGQFNVKIAEWVGGQVLTTTACRGPAKPALLQLERATRLPRETQAPERPHLRSRHRYDSPRERMFGQCRWSCHRLGPVSASGLSRSRDYRQSEGHIPFCIQPVRNHHRSTRLQVENVSADVYTTDQAPHSTNVFFRCQGRHSLN